MTRYPSLGPPPIIDWSPGSARLYHTDQWLPVDTALQFQYHGKTGEGDTIATLSLYSQDATAHRPLGIDLSPSIAIELTHGDIIELLAELMKAHHEEYHAENGD